MAEGKAYIAGGHVYCRVQRRDMDIEKCFSCTRLGILADEASPPYITCDVKGVVEDGDAARMFAEWRYMHHRSPREHI